MQDGKVVFLSYIQHFLNQECRDRLLFVLQAVEFIDEFEGLFVVVRFNDVAIVFTVDSWNLCLDDDLLVVIKEFLVALFVEREVYIGFVVGHDARCGSDSTLRQEFLAFVLE